MDIEAGIFTAMTAGTYSINFSGQADLEAGHGIMMYLHHNGQRVDESYWYTYNGGSGHIEEMGARSLVSCLPYLTLNFITAGPR